MTLPSAHESNVRTLVCDRDQMLHRLTLECDLVLSYWGRTPEKLNTLTMLQGHIDYSPVLAVLGDAPKTFSLTDKILQFPLSVNCPNRTSAEAARERVPWRWVRGGG